MHSPSAHASSPRERARGPLDRFVERIEVIAPRRGEPFRRVDELPDGTTNLVIRLLGDGASDAGVRGPNTRAHYKVTPAIPLVVVAVFRPGGAYPFFGVPIHALADRMISLEDLWGARGVCIRERILAEAEAGGDVAELVESTLLGRMREEPFEPASAIAARAAVKLIAQGDRSLGEVASELGISDRHLRRAFQSTVGVAPKTFARIARFQRALALGRGRSGHWNEVARATGYFDQAHLIAEFRKLARVSPGALGGAPARSVC